MGVQMNLIIAVCSNNGIGFKGSLPWSLRNELKHFTKLTKEVKNPDKMNGVVMGRKTWDSVPKRWRPLPERCNFVLSTQPLDLTGAVLCSSFDDIIEKINSPEYASKLETVWIIGGKEVYEKALEQNLCHRIYLTRIMKEYECDTFFHHDFSKEFKEVSDERVPKGIQEENQIQYEFHVYERVP